MNWVRGPKIGHGSFGTVNLAIPTNQNCSKLMAVKSCGVAHSASLINDKFILEELNGCSQIIACFGDCYSVENGEKLYNVLLEYAPGGSLADKIKNSNDNQLPEFEVKRYTKDTLRGLQFIHKNVHKLQNILLGQNDDVKIADFGLARKDDLKEKSNSSCELRGTPIYMSPEMVIGGEQGCPADIWAVGCVVLEMLTGAPAWRYFDVASLLMKIGVGEEVPEIPKKMSIEGKDFLEKCFAKDPSKRWTAKMLLDHPFILNLDESQYGNILVMEDMHAFGQYGNILVMEDMHAFGQYGNPTVSLRCPFDFPNWLSQSSLLTPRTMSELDFDFGRTVSLAAERLKGLVSKPDWSVEDEWMAVR